MFNKLKALLLAILTWTALSTGKLKTVAKTNVKLPDARKAPPPNATIMITHSVPKTLFTQSAAAILAY